MLFQKDLQLFFLFIIEGQPIPSIGTVVEGDHGVLRVEKGPTRPEDIRNWHEQNRLLDQLLQICFFVAGDEIRGEMRVIS